MVEKLRNELSLRGIPYSEVGVTQDLAMVGVVFEMADGRHFSHTLPREEATADAFEAFYREAVPEPPPPPEMNNELPPEGLEKPDGQPPLGGSRRDDGKGRMGDPAGDPNTADYQRSLAEKRGGPKVGDEGAGVDLEGARIRGDTGDPRNPSDKLGSGGLRSPGDTADSRNPPSSGPKAGGGRDDDDKHKDDKDRKK